MRYCYEYLCMRFFSVCLVWSTAYSSHRIMAIFNGFVWKVCYYIQRLLLYYHYHYMHVYIYISVCRCFRFVHNDMVFGCWVLCDIAVHRYNNNSINGNVEIITIWSFIQPQTRHSQNRNQIYTVCVCVRCMQYCNIFAHEY